MLEIASCDRQSEVYLDEDAVYRVVHIGHEDSVSQVLKAVDAIDGIVATEICHDKELLATLASKKHKLVLKHKKHQSLDFQLRQLKSLSHTHLVALYY